jgi:branched-chain amino acid aminotransferase
MPRHAWLNGEIVPWEHCVLHARTQGAFWGANVFEGVRAYWCPEPEQLYAFRLDDHLARLRRSMKSVHMEIRHSDADLRAACQQLLRANEYREDVHLVVVAYFGMAPNLEGLSLTDDTGVHITAIPMPRSPACERGAAACISSWRRISDDTMPPRIKTGANYHNSRLAHQEARRNGYDTALILNQRGTVAEGPGACVMMARDGRLVTPPGTSGVLEGITVASVAEIAREHLGLDLDVREIDRTELYVADEVFLCGTLVEIMPITSLDRILVGDGAPGPVARQLQARYDRLTHGAGADRGLLLPVYATGRRGILAGVPEPAESLAGQAAGR